jgi:hypothetical protein
MDKNNEVKSQIKLKYRKLISNESDGSENNLKYSRSTKKNFFSRYKKSIIIIILVIFVCAALLIYPIFNYKEQNSAITVSTTTSTIPITSTIDPEYYDDYEYTEDNLTSEKVKTTSKILTTLKNAVTTSKNTVLSNSTDSYTKNSTENNYFDDYEYYDDYEYTEDNLTSEKVKTTSKILTTSKDNYFKNKKYPQCYKVNSSDYSSTKCFPFKLSSNITPDQNPCSIPIEQLTLYEIYNNQKDITEHQIESNRIMGFLCDVNSKAQNFKNCLAYIVSSGLRHINFYHLNYNNFTLEDSKPIEEIRRFCGLD